MQVTIGLPFFNAERTLGAAVASVLNQTFEDWKLLLVDDGSADGSIEAMEWALSDRRVRLFSDGKNLGLSARLNQIATLTTTPFLARMDADDVMHPDRLGRQLNLITGEGADVVGSSAYIVDEALRVVGLRWGKAFYSRAQVLRRGGFIHPSCLGRVSWFNENAYSPSYTRAEDLELWVRTVERSRFAVLDEPLMFYREPRQPQLEKYRVTWRTERRILQEYGPSSLGAAESRFRQMMSHLKPAIYQLAAPFEHATNKLLERRCSAISERQRLEAESVLIRAMQVKKVGRA